MTPSNQLPWSVCACLAAVPGHGRPRAGAAEATGGSEMGSYRERLLVPVSYWLLAVPVVVSLGAEAYFFVDGWSRRWSSACSWRSSATFLVHWSAATIEVTGTVLRAGKDTLALERGQPGAGARRAAGGAAARAEGRPGGPAPAAALPQAGRLRRPRRPERGRAVLAGRHTSSRGTRGRDRGRHAWRPAAGEIRRATIRRATIRRATIRRATSGARRSGGGASGRRWESVG